jgi:MFS family permease
MTTIETDVPSATRTREPKGFAARYGLANFGLFIAILAPTFLALSLKVQNLVIAQDGPGVPRAESLAHAAALFGIVAGAGSLFALVSQPLAGRLSDRTVSRFGMRKLWIVVGVVGAFVSLAVAGFAPNTPILIIAFCAAEVFSNFAQAAETASVADQVPVSRRGVISGIAGACTPIAILVVALGLPAIPGDGLKWTIPALIGLAFGLLFAFTLKDRVLAKKPEGGFGIKEFLGSFYFNPKTHSSLGWAWLTKAMIMWGYISATSFLTLFLATDFGMNQAQQGAFNGEAQALSVVFMVILSIVSGRLSDRFGRRRLFVTLGGIISGVGIVIVAIAGLVLGGGGLGLILIGMAIVGIGMGMFFAVDQALCLDVLPSADDTAKDLGVLNIANTLPGLIVPLVGGTLLIPLGQSLFGAGYPLMLIIGAVISIAGGFLVYRIKGVK